MKYGNIKKVDIADGIGVRVSLFVSGCRNKCPGCFNEATWDFEYGQSYTKETEEEIISLLQPDFIDGFTLLGGEPFEEENQKECLEILKEIKNKFPNKNIWCYTGYLLDKDLCEGGKKYTPYTDEMISYIDVLVDGPFMVEKKNLMLKFRGSTNQRVIDLNKTRTEKQIVLYLE